MPSKRTDKSDQHKEKPLFLRLPPEYHEALELLAKKNRRTLTSEAKIALEAYFEKNGLPVPTTND